MAKFSRKDYVSTANMLANYVTDWDQLVVLAMAFADMYLADNERFDVERFLIACGVD